jgi:hypothetical protein
MAWTSCSAPAQQQCDGDRDDERAHHQELERLGWTHQSNSQKKLTTTPGDMS